MGSHSPAHAIYLINWLYNNRYFLYCQPLNLII
nr:MAG TPA: hypothetical protein [Caudoviricetes sp.]